MTTAFIKMHGLGNDFVIVDLRKTTFVFTPRHIQRIADRRLGIGCDQVIILDKSTSQQADLSMKIFNADGTEAGTCGNATRCVARYEMEARDVKTCAIMTVAGLLRVESSAGEISANMGKTKFEWSDIPLASEADTLHLDLSISQLPVGACVNIGNPHIVFFVDDVHAVDIAMLGPEIEHHALFPERINAEFVQILNATTIRMRVWERGAGITPACGSGACAAWIAAVRRGLVERGGVVHLDGGSLSIVWRDDGSVQMSGPASFGYSGAFTEELFAA